MLAGPMRSPTMVSLLLLRSHSSLLKRMKPARALASEASAAPPAACSEQPRADALDAGLQELAAAPGLLHWQEFAEHPEACFARAWGIADAVAALAAATANGRVSPDHNLPNQREVYVPIVLPDKGRLLRCEHFAAYGEGHELTYFRSTRNLPSAVLPLVEKLGAVPAIRHEVFAARERLGRRGMDAPLQWRLTLNRYEAGARPGFPWHRDIEANGAVTAILGLGSSGRLQFAEDPGGVDRRLARKQDGLRYGSQYDPCVDLILQAGDLLALTGRSRWEMVHRVVGKDAGDARVSLVFGCW